MGVIVRQKVKGKGKPWWVFVSHNGQRTSRQVGDKGAAEKVASDIRARLQLGDFGFEDKKAIPTFKEYADSWIKTTIPATCKESTVEDYRDILRIHVLHVFEDLPMKDITRGMVKDFLLGKINDGYAKNTVCHMKDVISGVLNKALDDEVIMMNPTYKLGRYLKAKDRKKNINPLTAEELKTLLDAVQVYYPNHYLLFLLLARTGLRAGEALALKWGDIDFKGRFINVQRSYRKGRIETPKNGKSRSVDMSAQLTQTLVEFKEKLDQEAAPKVVSISGEHRIEKRDIPEWIFTNGNGKLVDLDNWRHRVFNKVLEKAGIRKIRVHDLRHSYATIRISKGDSISDVSKQLGHHSVKLTLDTYFHWVPGKKKAEVDALDDPEFMHSPAPHLHPAPSKKENRLAKSG